MKELEIDLPKSDDTGVIARVKRLHFYSVREDFITVWKNHEQLLLDYEERVKSTIQRHARIGNYVVNQFEPVTKQPTQLIGIYLIQFQLMQRIRRRKLKRSSQIIIHPFLWEM